MNIGICKKIILTISLYFLSLSFAFGDDVFRCPSSFKLDPNWNVYYGTNAVVANQEKPCLPSSIPLPDPETCITWVQPATKREPNFFYYTRIVMNDTGDGGYVHCYYDSSIVVIAGAVIFSGGYSSCQIGGTDVHDKQTCHRGTIEKCELICPSP